MRITSVSLIVSTLFILHTNSYGMEPTEQSHHHVQKDIEAIKKDVGQMRKDLGDVIGVISPTLGQKIRGEEYPAIANNPYKNTVAHVRQGTDISEGEKAYRLTRLPIVDAALKKFGLQCEQHQIPTIAVVNSGGGYRAALATTGFLLGLKKIKLLDAITYITALSGSTGAIIPWISAQYPLKDFKEYMLDCVTKPFTETTDKEELLIFEAAAIKSLFNQPKTPVDPYGALLSNRFLNVFQDEKQSIVLSQQQKIIKNGRYPYPIYCAVDANEKISENPDWYEYTPDEVGNPIDETYIPTWAYGRKFKNGESIKDTALNCFPPAKSTAHCLGTFWSAFGAPNHLVKEEIAKKFEGNIGNFIRSLAPSHDGEHLLHFYAEIPNYMYKMEGLKNPASAQERISTRVDAGTDFNLPVSPVNQPGRRAADVIIICDASADKVGDDLQKTIDYMKRHKLPFPKIDFGNIDKRTISIFKDNDPAVPTIIYMPRLSDSALLEQHLADPQFKQYEHLKGFDFEHETNHGFAQTIHFQYERHHALKVVDQMEFNVRAHQAEIMQALQFAVEKKKQIK